MVRPRFHLQAFSLAHPIFTFLSFIVFVWFKYFILLYLFHPLLLLLLLVVSSCFGKKKSLLRLVLSNAYHLIDVFLMLVGLGDVSPKIDLDMLLYTIVPDYLIDHPTV